MLDAGAAETGRPYFVMELVKGVPITTFCDEKQLGVPERLSLFVSVCQAVQHAHQKGIIHRDLKPSNILVAQYDDRSVPKIIDFGVAKATNQRLTEKTLFTRFGQIVGTFAYMSPEQTKFNELDVDTRTDLYSLGVVLYELLTGNTPHDKRELQQAALEEILRIIRNEDPPRPSARLSSIDTLPTVAANRHVEPKRLATMLRGELDWIVMKTLEKDRSRRYETANALAMDIQRHLENEPVTACPPSTTYRVRKAIRRHKVTFASISAVMASLVFGLFGTAWFAVKAARRAEEEHIQRQRAVSAEILARARLKTQQEATKTAEKAVATAQKSLFDLYTSFGQESGDSGDPATATLWFAEAAKLDEPASSEEEYSRIRHASWSQFAPNLMNRFEHNGRLLREFEYDATGQFIASLTEDGMSYVWHVEGKARVLKSMSGIVHQTWHPHLPIIAIASEDTAGLACVGSFRRDSRIIGARTTCSSSVF